MKKMDYTIGFQAGHAGQKWTATALTDRAKERTPAPVTFASRPEALAFLKDSQAAGYRFSGAELVDPAEKLVKNRYFVIGGNAQLTPAGEDNGPRNTVWEVGDVKPGSGGMREPRRSLKTSFKGRGCENGLVATSCFCFVSTGSCRVLSLCPYRPSTPRSRVHAASTGGSMATAAAIKASMLWGTRCCEEMPRGWCRGPSRRFSPAWSRVIPGFGSCGIRSGRVRRPNLSISFSTPWSMRRWGRIGSTGRRSAPRRNSTRWPDGALRWWSFLGNHRSSMTAFTSGIRSRGRSKPTSALDMTSSGYSCFTSCPSP